jgi:hypothetical protein
MGRISSPWLSGVSIPCEGYRTKPSLARPDHNNPAWLRKALVSARADEPLNCAVPVTVNVRCHGLKPSDAMSPDTSVCGSNGAYQRQTMMRERTSTMVGFTIMKHHHSRIVQLEMSWECCAA